MVFRHITFFLLLLQGLAFNHCFAGENKDLPLYYWQQNHFVNFGDYLSLKLVERIVNQPVRVYQKKNQEKKLLAIGSILFFANEDDILWGTGTNGKKPLKEDYSFSNLDIRAVRGPLTRAFLEETLGINCPEVYGDPALLVPYFFPEFKKKKHPKYKYIVIPHYSENHLFPKKASNIVYSTDPWDEIIHKITDSEFVISSSLHGIIVAEAFGIPAKLLRVTDNEPLLKYIDYYMGTGRDEFTFATSIEEALEMGGEPPIQCDLEALYNAFPFEHWPNVKFRKPDFSKK